MFPETVRSVECTAVDNEGKENQKRGKVHKKKLLKKSKILNFIPKALNLHETALDCDDPSTAVFKCWPRT